MPNFSARDRAVFDLAVGRTFETNQHDDLLGPVRDRVEQELIQVLGARQEEPVHPRIGELRVALRQRAHAVEEAVLRTEEALSEVVGVA